MLLAVNSKTLHLEFLTENEMEPSVRKAVSIYKPFLVQQYGNNLITESEAVKKILGGLITVCIDEQYLFCYSIGKEFFTRENTMYEEFLVRIEKGKSTLVDVFNVIRLLKKTHSVSYCYLGTRMAKNQEAIQRYYRKNGAENIMRILRI